MKCSIVKNKNTNYLRLEIRNKIYKFSPIWLIEHSSDITIRDKQTNQLLIEAAELDLNLKINNFKIIKSTLSISFSNNSEHNYNINDLIAPKEYPKKTLWNSSLKKIPQYNFKKFNQNLLKDVLNAVDEYGFCLIKNMPTTKNGIHALTKHIGPIKETNWGNIADIKNIKKAYDLTMTERALENHTDNPYRFPTQGYIFLHCIKNSDVGGENTLADGFNIAKQIKSKNIEMFNILKSFKTFFQYKDKDTILENYCSLIETDYEDNIVQVRYNNRTEIIPYDDLCEINKYTEARSKFWKLIKSKVNNITIKQTSGDMIIMDNYRVLHGRSKYKDIKNQRYFRQGYLDRDILQSRLKTLAQ
tara:strand:+ start:884 stop:1960 length:1077 start_codon:yes stop_codon:yes gene_type:complete